MDKAMTVAIGDNKAPAAQAGKLLCVSETIYPRGLRHCTNSICSGGMRAGGELRPSSYVRIAGKEFVDLRELDPTVRLPGPAGGL